MVRVRTPEEWMVETESRSLAALTPRVTRAWYIVATSAEVKHKPLKAQLFGEPLVVFRDAQGAPHVLVDRCPHRGVPLSLGTVEPSGLRCGYHGWCFDGSGACVEVPGLPGEPGHPARKVGAHATVEQQGFVWAWGEVGSAPVGEPFRFRHADDGRYLTVRRVLRTRGNVHAVIENALDVPHTAFLHGGLFRTARKDRRPIRCVVRRYHDRAECEFIGEQAPKGLAARLLAPRGGELTHVDRFWMPSITEVEYHLGEDVHLVLNGACTPVTDWDTVLYAVVSIRTRLPHWLVRAVMQPLALRIFAQDADILTVQVDALQRAGEASFVSTEIDVLGSHILRLMHRGARGDVEAEGAEPVVRETTMLV